MRELGALAGRHLRTAWRRPALRIALGLYLLALLAAALAAGDGVGAAGLFLLGALGALTLWVVGQAVGAGHVLPGDRLAGREDWLATLPPPGWKRRAALVLAAWVLVVGVGATGGAAAGLVASALRDDVELQAHAPAVLPPDLVLGPGAPLRVALPGRPAGTSALEIEVRPLFRRGVLPADRVVLEWQAGGQARRTEVSVRGPLRLAPPPAARELFLALHTPHVRLRLAAARWLEPPRAALGALALAGLLLGLLAATAVPLAVLVSRVTSSQTAAAAAFALLCVAALQPVLADVGAAAPPQGAGALASSVLAVVGWAAPPAPVAHVVAEVAALRAPSGPELALALPALLYTVVLGVLACLPAPRRLRQGSNA